MNLDLRDKAADFEKEIDMLKNQRADNFREISRLKEVNEMKSREGAE